MTGRRCVSRFSVMVRDLLGLPPLPLPEIPGRRIVARDEPLPEDELVGITCCTELALLAGITRQAASQRLAKRRAQERAAC